MEASNMKAMREALENCANMGEQIDYQLGSSDETVYAFRDERCLGHNISECARAALAKPPRACDVMSQEDLTKVVISGFMKSLGSLGIGPENQLVSQLAEAAISAAIKCAYDTQLVVKKGGEK